MRVAYGRMLLFYYSKFLFFCKLSQIRTQKMQGISQMEIPCIVGIPAWEENRWGKDLYDMLVKRYNQPSSEIPESSKPTTSVRIKPAIKLTTSEIRNGIKATVQNTGSVVSAGNAKADA